MPRRTVLLGAAALAAAPRVLAATPDELANLPVIPKTVVKVFNKAPRIKEPNALQFAPDGNLWILDQVDPNKVFTVNPADGSILAEFQTESLHGSGITLGNGAWWITSTKGKGTAPPMTLKVDPKTGGTLKSFVTPGAGLYGKVTTVSGAHGVRWVDGHYWMAVPASGKIFLMEPESGRIVRSIPAPVERTHDLGWDQGALWCVGTGEREIYKLDPRDGKPLAKIKLTKADPEPHGFDIRRGEPWYCDAVSGWVCKLV
jgi:streptogramin lyase